MMKPKQDESTKFEGENEEAEGALSMSSEYVEVGESAPGDVADDTGTTDFGSDGGESISPDYSSPPSGPPPDDSGSDVSPDINYLDPSQTPPDYAPNYGADDASDDAPDDPHVPDSEHENISGAAVDLADAMLFDRLSTSARSALAVADALRGNLRQEAVHMEHLIFGLTDKKHGPTRAVLLKANIGEEKLRAIIEEIVETRIPDDFSTLRIDRRHFYQLPPMSKHVREALVAASKIADERGSKAIQSRHLIYGALSVECSVIRALKFNGVNREDINLDGESSPANATPDAGGDTEKAADDAQAGHVQGETTQTRAERKHANAGFRSDTADGDDMLDIEQEVEALCTVLASKDVEPPVSLGLFGDWGSGKSFFMRKMEARFKKLTATARECNGDSAYCSNIVQLWFNAWHYMDTNLWASLASEIFEGLAQALDKEIADENDPKTRSERERERACLLTAAASSKNVLAEAERMKELAAAELQDSEQRLKSLESDEREIENSLSEGAVAHAVYRFVAEQPDVREKLKQAGKALKISDAEVAVTDVKATLLELHGLAGWFKAFRISLGNEKGLRVWLLLLLAVVVALVVVALSMFYKDSIIRPLGTVVSILGAAAVALRPYVAGAWRAVKLVEDARAAKKQLIESEKAKKVGELKEQQESIRERVTKAQQRVAAASEEVERIERRLDELRADSKMANFIRKRHESTDYTRHLGVIARAHNDFKQLSDLLAKVRKQVDEETEAALKKQKEDEEAKRAGRPPKPPEAKKEAGDGDKLRLPRIDRIVLYIDDLDRCPEEKVVDVLQAVHLLLAFPLFVVVVGVDPRWLLHSLKQHSKVFREKETEDEGQSDEERAHWQSTPLNYLEKIFQIPFTLRPMESDGFNKLIKDLTKPSNAAAAHQNGRGNKTDATKTVETKTDATLAPEPEKTNEVAGGSGTNDANNASGAGDGQIKSAASTPPATDAEVNTAGATTTGVADAAHANGAEPPPKPVEPYPEYLLLGEQERAFMMLLHPLIPSPRAAKRFVNVYRLIRASVDIGDENTLKKFTGEGTEYRVVLFMLAMLTGYPDQATEILSHLLDDEPTTTAWWDFVESFRWRGEKHVLHQTEPQTHESLIDARNGGSNGDGLARSANDINIERWAQLMEKLDALRPLFEQEQSCGDFVYWAPKVARYSFRSGRVLLAQGAADATPSGVGIRTGNSVEQSGAGSNGK